MMFRSIRVKLTIWYLCVLALIIAILAGAMYSMFVRVLNDEMDQNIAEIANSVVESATEEPEGETHHPPDAVVKEALDEFRFRDYQFAVFTDGKTLVSKTIEKDVPPALVGSTEEGSFIDLDIGGESYRVYMTGFQIDSRKYQLYVFRSLADQMALKGRIRGIFYLFAPLLLLFAGTGGYFLARKSLNPITMMAERAKNISAHNLHERLPVADPKDELGNLALTFNELLDRLDFEFDRQRRFMADASHELRTPLAIIRGESEVALLNETRDADEYQTSLRIVNDESARLSAIVEDLFTLARADSGALKADLREMYIDELLAECIRSVRTLADKRNITIEMDSREALVEGDERLLRRLLINLLDNAIKHNYHGGTITAVAGPEAVVISNTGPTIPDEMAHLIFDRFYRAEKMRSGNFETALGGAGLGLAIAKLIAELHNAGLTYSRVGDENVFTLEFSG